MRDLHTEAHKRRTFPIGCVQQRTGLPTTGPEGEEIILSRSGKKYNAFGAGYAACTGEQWKFKNMISEFLKTVKQIMMIKEFKNGRKLVHKKDSNTKLTYIGAIEQDLVCQVEDAYGNTRYDGFMESELTKFYELEPEERYVNLYRGYGSTVIQGNEYYNLGEALRRRKVSEEKFIGTFKLVKV